MPVLKLAASVIFGVAFPIVILFQAYVGLASLTDNVSYRETTSDLIANLAEARATIESANDYALFSLLYVEHANQKTMNNKQVMKTSVMHIGFAVISIGMMLIIFGIQGGGTGGAEGAVSVKDITFDFKTGSTGVAVFCIGAMMATLGGVLKNEYTTSTIPNFGPVQTSSAAMPNQPVKYLQSLDAFKKCAGLEEKESANNCFMQAFLQINKDALK